jgi:cyclohexanecarboxylate-CoA ligase
MDRRVNAPTSRIVGPLPRRDQREEQHTKAAMGGLDPERDRVAEPPVPLVVPRAVPAELAARYRRDGWWPDVTLPGLLRRWVARAPGAPAVIAPGRVLTFADLDHESDRVAAGLERLGVGRGDVVSCQLANVPEMLVLHHAVAKRRAVFSPVHLPYRGAEVETILGFAGSRVMVVGPPHRSGSYVDMMLGLRARLPALGHIVALGEPPRDGVLAWEELCGTSRPAHDETPHPDDPFLLLFTSGTTASPKATLHTHNMRLGNARPIGRGFGLGPDDRVLSIARLSHMWGIMMYWVALWAGASHVLLDTFSPDEFAGVVERFRATVAIGAPAHVADILGSAPLGAEPLRSLRVFALSGTVCPPALARRLRATVGCAPILLWGMTETGNGLYTRPDDPPDVAEHTVGRASDGCEFAILDETGRPLGRDQEGELAIRGPFVFGGYVNNAEATAESFTPDGWFLTGDLGSMDAAGNVRLHGRRKEQINRGGVKFHPADVEEILLRHPAVQLAALVAMPDERLGERNCCFVLPRAGALPPTLAELTALLDEASVAKFKWPERLEIVDSLPLTPTGKVQRAVLRDRLTAR